MPRKILLVPEHVITCYCGAKIAYTEKEIGPTLTCSYCNTAHKLDGSHPTFIFSPVKVTTPTKKLEKLND